MKCTHFCHFFLSRKLEWLKQIIKDGQYTHGKCVNSICLELGGIFFFFYSLIAVLFCIELSCFYINVQDEKFVMQ